MKILLVSLYDKGFHRNAVKEMVKSIVDAGHTVLEFESIEQRWERILSVAHINQIDLIYFARIVDTQMLYMAVRSWDVDIAFLMTGYSYTVRHPKQEEAFLNLLKLPHVKRVFINTALPSSLAAFLTEKYGKVDDKITLTFDQPLETKEFYRDIPRDKARETLNIPQDKKIAQYFGTYWYSKGCDLLLEVAKSLPEIDFYMVGDTKLGSFDYDIKESAQNGNVYWVDEYVSEEKARDYFRACDIVVMPYRKFYEHDPSGVFVKAMLAERPVVAPMIQPFKDIAYKYDVGLFYKCEDMSDLRGAIKAGFDVIYDCPYTGFDSYLDLMAEEGWKVIGEKL
jgi:glycosyltransferase involved in cell wall biosynthesis